jgi:GTP-binding protein HflX
VENKLFSTLDATTRALVFPGREKVLLTDTVGFIRRLPHGIISSFHSTLQEAIEADLRLHVIDIAYPYAELQIMAGNEILDTLGVREKPTIYVFNKIDLDSTLIPHLRHKYPSAVFVSALNGEGIEDLEQRIFEFVKEKKGITGPGE